MRIGFTGSQYAEARDEALVRSVLLTLPPDSELVVGACEGIDDLVARLGMELGFRVHAVVPANRDKVAKNWRLHCTSYEEMLKGTDYMARNDRVVELSARLIVFADCTERLRSGTWATARRGRRKGILASADIYYLVR